MSSKSVLVLAWAVLFLVHHAQSVPVLESNSMLEVGVKTGQKYPCADLMKGFRSQSCPGDRKPRLDAECSSELTDKTKTSGTLWKDCVDQCCTAASYTSHGLDAEVTANNVAMSSIFAVVEGMLKESLGESCKNTAQATYEWLNMYSKGKVHRDENDEDNMHGSYRRALNDADSALDEMMEKMEQAHGRGVASTIGGVLALPITFPSLLVHKGVKKIRNSMLTDDAFSKTFLRAFSSAGFAMFEEAFVRSNGQTATVREKCEKVFDLCADGTEVKDSDPLTLSVIDVPEVCYARNKTQGATKDGVCASAALYKVGTVFWERLHRRYKWLNAHPDKRFAALDAWSQVLSSNLDDIRKYIDEQAQCANCGSGVVSMSIGVENKLEQVEESEASQGKDGEEQTDLHREDTGSKDSVEKEGEQETSEEVTDTEQDKKSGEADVVEDTTSESGGAEKKKRSRKKSSSAGDDVQSTDGAMLELAARLWEEGSSNAEVEESSDPVSSGEKETKKKSSRPMSSGEEQPEQKGEEEDSSGSNRRERRTRRRKTEHEESSVPSGEKSESSESEKKRRPTRLLRTRRRIDLLKPLTEDVPSEEKGAEKKGPVPGLFGDEGLKLVRQVGVWEGEDADAINACDNDLFLGLTIDPQLCVMLDHFILATHALHEEAWRGSTSNGELLDKFMEMFAVYSTKLLKAPVVPTVVDVHECSAYSISCQQPQNFHKSCDYALPASSPDHCSKACCLTEDQATAAALAALDPDAEAQPNVEVNHERICERMSSVVEYVMLHLEGNNVRANEAMRKWNNILGSFNTLLEAGAAAGGAAAGGAVGSGAAGAMAKVVTGTLTRLSETTITETVALKGMSRNLRLAFLKSLKSLYFSDRRTCYPTTFLRQLYHVAFAPRGVGTTQALSSMLLLRQLAAREYGKKNGVAKSILHERSDIGTSVRGLAADSYMLDQLASISTDKLITEYLGKALGAAFTAHKDKMQSIAQSPNSMFKVLTAGGAHFISNAVLWQLRTDYAAAVSQQQARESFETEQVKAGKTPEEAHQAWLDDQAAENAAKDKLGIKHSPTKDVLYNINSNSLMK